MKLQPGGLEIVAKDVVDLLVGFLEAEVSKVGFSRVVLGLSGGVDSAVVAALATRAFGPSRVIAAILPYRTSTPASLADARAVADTYGLEPRVLDISPQIDAYFAGHPDASKERRGNKMARERMTVLYDLSMAENALVVGTTNKTELLLGYGTQFGDLAHALNPLGDLYKQQVFALARALGVPAQIVDKPPSADLWEGQSDEDELGFTYEDVDTLLYGLIDERRSDEELLALGVSQDFLATVKRRIQTNQFKRRLPVIAKVGSRTVDRDFRYPRDWGR